MKKIIFAVMFLMLAGLNLSISMIVLCGMIPTMIMWFFHPVNDKMAALCMAPMNAVGVMIVLMEFLSGPQSTDAATQILIGRESAVNWVIMFGMAALGWGIYYSVPHVYAGFAQVRVRQQITQLKAEQKRLVEEWGEAVGKQRVMQSDGQEEEE